MQLILIAVFILHSLLHCVWSSLTLPGPGGFAWDRNTNKRSTRLCEDDNEFFHNETRKCYIPTSSLKAQFSAESGPCGELQRFYEVDENYGTCACQRDDSEKPGCNDLINRPVLDWPESNRCYYAYSKGPCRPGEWIVMNHKTLRAECQPNPCHDLKLQKPVEGLDPAPKKAEIFYFLEDDRCYQTFTRAFCGLNEHLQFFGTHATPECSDGKSRCAVQNIGTLLYLPCAPGFRQIGDDCIPMIHFD